MTQQQRRAKIRDHIDMRGEATVTELAALCSGCSGMTLWRDLNALEQEGFLRRTRGGAIAMRMLQPEAEGIYSLRARENPEQKRAVAQLALPYVRPGCAIYLDAGSTIMQLARLLKDGHYTIVTSGANIAIELSRCTSASILLVGGQIACTSLSCSGPQAEAALNSINIETAIMATSGFSLQSGFTSGVSSERELKRAVVQKASRVVMLLDSTKLNRSLPFTFCTLDDIGTLLVDKPLPKEFAAAASAAGVTVIVAGE